MHIAGVMSRWGETAAVRARRKGYNELAEFVENYKPPPRGELALV